MVDCCDIDGCQYYGDSISTICPDHMKQFIDQQAEIDRLEAELAEANKRVDYYKKQAGEFNQAYSRVQKELTDLEESLCINPNAVSASLNRANWVLDIVLGFCGKDDASDAIFAIRETIEHYQLAAHLAGKPVDLPPSLRERCLEALYDTEWLSELDGSGCPLPGICPSCGNFKCDGHALTCTRAALISDLEQPVEDK